MKNKKTLFPLFLILSLIVSANAQRLVSGGKPKLFAAKTGKHEKFCLICISAKQECGL